MMIVLTGTWAVDLDLGNKVLILILLFLLVLVVTSPCPQGGCRNFWHQVVQGIHTYLASHMWGTYVCGRKGWSVPVLRLSRGPQLCGPSPKFLGEVVGLHAEFGPWVVELFLQQTTFVRNYNWSVMKFKSRLRDRMTSTGFCLVP